MHAEYFQGVTQEYSALALRGPIAGLPPNSGAGLMLNTVGFGDIQRTTLSNPRGTGLDSFGIRDWALDLGVGKKLKWDWLGVGAAIKYLREDIDSVSAQAAAVDIGMRATLQSSLDVPLTFGVSLQNLGTKMRFQSNREDLPINAKFGAAYHFLNSGLLALDINQPREGVLTINVGTEYVALKSVALRVGYNGRNDTDTGITFGGGLTRRHFGFDYAFVPFGDLGNAHRFSLNYRW